MTIESLKYKTVLFIVTDTMNRTVLYFGSYIWVNAENAPLGAWSPVP